MSLLVLDPEFVQELPGFFSKLLLINDIFFMSIKMIEDSPALVESLIFAFGPNTKYNYENSWDVKSNQQRLRVKLIGDILDFFDSDAVSFEIAATIAHHASLNFPDVDKMVIGRICDKICSEKIRIEDEKAEMMTMATKMNVSIGSFEPNEGAGVNLGKIFKDEFGTKYFIKTFSDWDNNGTIDPGEALVYKLLEYLSLGPETKFLLKSSSEGQGGDVRGNYIKTKDVAAGSDSVFLLDQAVHYPSYFKALTESFEANVEFCALSTVNDIAMLGDTFGANATNYGMLFPRDGNVKNVRFALVDHMPYLRNCQFPPYRFAKDEPYSPRLSIQKRLDRSHFDAHRSHFDAHSGLVALTGQRDSRPAPLVHARAQFPRTDLVSAIDEKLAAFPDAVSRAAQCVHELIAEGPDCFVEDAGARVDAYVQLMLHNYGTYQTMA